MQKIIQQITQDLIDRLPENDQYYELEDLRTWEFPSFIARRIGVELKRNLSESMMIPKTDWANTGTEAVRNAWQQFIDAIRDEARLPASYAQAVIETSVSDVIDILIQPRKNIPEVIFGAAEDLAAEEVQSRLEAIVVYRHFGVLISRYLQKKKVEQFTKKRCAKIIGQADEKLTSGYSPLDWSQLLEPLFVLSDGKVDTNLIRLFFEDKNRPRIARKFDLMDDVVSRAEFIEVLSSPDLLDFDGYEDDQSSLFKDQPAAEGPDNDLLNQEGEEKELPSLETDIEGKGAPESSPEEPLTTEEEADEENEEDDSLNGAFSDPLGEEDEDDKKTISAEEDPVTDESKKEISAKQDMEEGNGEENSENSSSKNGSMTTADEGVTEISSREKSEEEETPMWMRYMSDEEIEEYKKEQAESEENVDEDGFIDEPIIDLTKDASDKEIDRLMDMLKNDREFFVEEIFRGSDRAYEEAVEDIAGYDSWRDVSKYIEKEVFKRNMVDMYSEAAVDFTDQLQSYFLEKQNRNKQEN
ncbi:MAG: hypothetical protein ACQEST_06695 [Bacteroidota bacterium]